MSIWTRPLNLEGINKFNQNTLVSHLGISITNSGEDFLEAIMPVEPRTHQPFGLLHGGASCVLAESLGSIAANLTIDASEFMAVGQHIEATHLKSVREGLVRGVARAIHLGKSSQLWRIEIFNETQQLICDAKILMAVVKKRSN